MVVTDKYFAINMLKVKSLVDVYCWLSDSGHSSSMHLWHFKSSPLESSFSDENDVVSNYFMRKEKRFGLLAGFNSVKEYVLGPQRGKKAF